MPTFRIRTGAASPRPEVHERLAQIVVGVPEATIPSRAPGASCVIALSPFRRAYCRASSSRTPVSVRSSSSDCGASRCAEGRCMYGPPSHSSIGVSGVTRSSPTSTVAGRVGDRRHDLERRPQTRGARARDRVPAEIDDLLHAARRKHRDVQRGEQRLRRARDRRRLARGIVAAQRQHSATRVGADEVAVADRVGGAVDTRGLAVPDSDHAVEARAWQRPGQLRAPHGRCGKLLVDRRLQDQLVLGSERSESSDLAHESGERRAGIAGDQRGRSQPRAYVGAVLVEQDSHQRLHAREEYAAFREEVTVLERGGASGPGGRVNGNRHWSINIPVMGNPQP